MCAISGIFSNQIDQTHFELVKKFNILNSPLNKIFDNYENTNFSFLGRLNIDTWNNSETLEMMLDDIIYEDVA